MMELICVIFQFINSENSEFFPVLVDHLYITADVMGSLKQCPPVKVGLAVLPVNKQQ